MSKGQELLSKTNSQRESEEYLESLVSSDKAIIAFQVEGSQGKLAETLSARSITFIHLYDQTKDQAYLILAKATASSAVEVAKLDKSQDQLAISLLGLGRIHAKLKEHQSAAKYYQEALDNLSNDRPSMLADVKIHLAASQYKTGDKSALERLINALADLEKADEDSYVKNVWVSGAYMKLAGILATDNPEESQKHLAKAKGIISSDPRLTIRLKQWTELSQALK
jgi:tetratricopeptide (TPR) repeat protein